MTRTGQTNAQNLFLYVTTNTSPESLWTTRSGAGTALPPRARELAMERMQAEAAALQAATIVGVSISQDNYAWESHVIEFFTLGTAVVPLATEHTIPIPSLTLPLNG